jgi:hypothetical protein
MMEKYELISKLEIDPQKALKYIDEFLTNFNEWDEYKDEYIGNEKITILDKKYWNEEYLDKHTSLLFSNFSKERLEHIKEIILYLYSNKEKENDEKVNSNFFFMMIMILIVIAMIITYLRMKNNQTVQIKNSKKIENNQTVQIKNSKKVN